MTDYNVFHMRETAQLLGYADHDDALAKMTKETGASQRSIAERLDTALPYVAWRVKRWDYGYVLSEQDERDIAQYLLDMRVLQDDELKAALEVRLRRCAGCGKTYDEPRLLCPDCRADRYIVREERIVRKQLAHARKHGLIATLTLSEWLCILNEHEWMCHWCHGTRGPYEHMDHVVPCSSGGGTTAHNVVPSCAWCNIHRGNRTQGGLKARRLTGVRADGCAGASVDSESNPNAAAAQLER